MTLAVTGASGQLGRLTADFLLHLTDPRQVVLITRDPASVADFAERGATVRHGDFDDPPGLPDAFAGVDRLLLLSTNAVGTRLPGQLAAVAAAAAAGVHHLLYTSMPHPDPTNPALPAPDHAATEAAIRQSGLSWTMLRNNLYADLQHGRLQHAGSTGQLSANSGQGGTAYVTRADCASAAAHALADQTDALTNEAIDVTGPQALTADDLAALAAGRAGRRVDVLQLDDDTYTAQLQSAGLPPAVAKLTASFGAAARQGLLADTTDAVATLTGHPPTSL